MKTIFNKYRYSAILLRQLVITDFKLRYQGSALGYLWSLLRPLALFVILYIVFGQFLNLGDSIPNFQIYLLLGIIIWSFFGETTNGSVTSIVGKGDLIRKINFPKYVIVLAGTISAFINLLLNFLVVAFFMVIAEVSIDFTILFVPLLIIELVILSASLAFFLSASYVKFRDISYIWEVIMQGAFYATPILYPLDVIPEKAAKLLILNPMAQIIQDFRYVLVTHKTITIDQLYGSQYARLIPTGIVVVIAIYSIYYFKKKSKYFAEDV